MNETEIVHITEPEIATDCIICGQTVILSKNEAEHGMALRAMICKDCKRAIQWAKTQVPYWQE